jgi:hypothetical protein
MRKYAVERYLKLGFEAFCVYIDSAAKIILAFVFHKYMSCLASK